METILVAKLQVIPIMFQITLDGVGVTGQAPKVSIQRASDSYYYTGSIWQAAPILLSMTEVGVTSFNGLYLYNFTMPNTDDRYTVRKINTGTYACDEYDTLVSTEKVMAASDIRLAVGLSSASIDTQLAGILKSVESNRLAIEYDFSTYSKAVILFYDKDRAFGATNPKYWCYVYKSNGGNPTTVSEISKRDRITLWTDTTPS
jgi:hypothetical protein